MAEISVIKPVERTINILNPGDKSFLGITVDLMSIDDDRLKKARRRIEDRRLSLAKKGDTFNAEEIDANKHELYFTAMTGWTWGKDANGEQNTFHDEVPDFNRRMVHMVFDELPWFRDQIEKELGETEAFFRA